MRLSRPQNLARRRRLNVGSLSLGALAFAFVASLASGANETRVARFADAFGGNAGAWTVSGSWRQEDGRAVAEPGSGGPSVASFTVPAGASGFYAIEDSSLRRDETLPGRIDLEVSVRRAHETDGRQPVPAVATSLEAGELFDFDAFLGYLDEGDVVRVAIGAAGDPAGDRTSIDFKIAPAPAIPVTVFPDDLSNEDLLDAPGRWFAARSVRASSAVARRLAWGRDAGAPSVVDNTARLPLESADGGDALVAFRVPHSGYYALHETWFAGEGSAVKAQVFIGDETEPRRVGRAGAASNRESLNADLGYIAKGDVIWLAFANAGDARTNAQFGGTIVEWAPRRPPLRVRRGQDGLLDVFEPEAPRRAIDIPPEHWNEVAAPKGDATEALRAAFADARKRQRGDAYVGIRLEKGKTYTVASEQVGGPVFPLRDTQRLVFDGNGAIIRVASPELTRKEVDLFSLAHSRNIVFADFAVEATSIPFTTGEILEVSPRGESTQTVTFRVDEGELDPLKDISRDGRNNAYAYDPKIPGRLALGTWTHYPGDGTPSIRATDTPGVFTHRVRRTNDSIEPGNKWLIKNKRGGVVYLTTRLGTENITLSGIDGRAAGGGQLRFWQTSGVNLLDCRFEPDGDNWISSSADGVHGRGREGVWIENTLIRGICEDIMNTYGQNMIVVADDAPDDAVMSIRMFTRSSESFDDGAARLPSEESLTAGDQLVFFNPATGRVLGYAGVVSIANGRYTLTNPVPGIDPWEERDGKNATMVYNTRIAGRFFVRDTRMMDSMRFGIYIKARGGVVFGSQFEGLSAPPIFAVNEPEWPEGPPATHLWVQGCTFSQNNYGYMPRHRDFMVVDPADISVYTRRFRQPHEPDDYRANLTRDQYANSHMKLIGNVFHDWRGMGISVRNSRNARIENNRFLAPVNDDVMRRTLAGDPALGNEGRGTYAAIFLDSVGGVRVSGNRFHDLPTADGDVVSAQDVAGLVAMDNRRLENITLQTVATLSFDEWLGESSEVKNGNGDTIGNITLGSGMHRAGKLGGGVHFSGGAPAVWDAEFSAANGLSFWVCPEEGSDGTVLRLGDEVVVALVAGRWQVRFNQGNEAAPLDLGAATPGLWQHVAVVFADGVRAYVDGLQLAQHDGPGATISTSMRIALGGGAFRGGIDEVRLTLGSPGTESVAAWALREGGVGR